MNEITAMNEFTVMTEFTAMNVFDVPTRRFSVIQENR